MPLNATTEAAIFEKGLDLQCATQYGDGWLVVMFLWGVCSHKLCPNGFLGTSKTQQHWGWGGAWGGWTDPPPKKRALGYMDSCDPKQSRSPNLSYRFCLACALTQISKATAEIQVPAHWICGVNGRVNLVQMDKCTCPAQLMRQSSNTSMVFNQMRFSSVQLRYCPHVIHDKLNMFAHCMCDLIH